MKGWMRITGLVFLMFSSIYTQQISYEWRFVKENIKIYYRRIGDPLIDVETQERIEDARRKWNSYLQTVGYSLSVISQGTSDILVNWLSIEELTWGFAEAVKQGFCGNIPIALAASAHLNKNHLPGGQFDPPHFELYGYTSIPSNEVSLYSVIAHELGHTLGLPDIMQPTSALMAGVSTGEYKDVTDYDAEMLIELYQQECQSVCIGYHYPPDGAQNVPVNTKITITFTRPMDTLSVMNAIIISPDFSKIFEWSNDLKTVTIIPADTLNDLKYETQYTVTILETAQDTAGNYMSPECAPYSFSFTTKSPEFELSVVPEHAKVPIGDTVYHNITILNKNPRKETFQLSFNVFQTSQVLRYVLPSETQFEIPANSQETAILKVYDPRSPDTCDYGNVSEFDRLGIDVSAKVLNTQREISKTVLDEPEKKDNAPVVESTEPGDGEQNVKADKDIKITFSKEMDTASVRSAIQISPSVEIISYEWSGLKDLTIKHKNFDLCTDYEVTISDMAEDTCGIPLDGDEDGKAGGDYTFSFRTESPSADMFLNPSNAVVHPGQTIPVKVIIKNHSSDTLEFEWNAYLTQGNWSLSPSFGYLTVPENSQSIDTFYLTASSDECDDLSASLMAYADLVNGICPLSLSTSGIYTKPNDPHNQDCQSPQCQGNPVGPCDVDDDDPDEQGEFSSNNPENPIILGDVFYSDTVPSSVGILHTINYGYCKMLLNSLGVPSVCVEIQDSIIVYGGDKKDLKVLVVPSGGLSGKKNDLNFKQAIEEFVSEGGIVYVFTQPKGEDFEVLPGEPSGYGWQEDQSCHSYSLFVDSLHPAIYSVGRQPISGGVDGFFEYLPSNSQVILRRTLSGKPAFAVYKYGKGYVFLSDFYDDWGSAHNQNYKATKHILKNSILWGITENLTDTFYSFDRNQDVQIPLRIINPGPEFANKIYIKVDTVISSESPLFCDSIVLSNPLAPLDTIDTLFFLPNPNIRGVYIVLTDFRGTDIYAKNIPCGGFGIKDVIAGGYQLPPVLAYLTVSEERPENPKRVKVRVHLENTTGDTVGYNLIKDVNHRMIYKELIKLLPYEKKEWEDRYFINYAGGSLGKRYRIWYKFPNFRLSKGVFLIGDTISSPRIQIAYQGNTLNFPIPFKIFIHPGDSSWFDTLYVIKDYFKDSVILKVPVDLSKSDTFEFDYIFEEIGIKYISCYLKNALNVGNQAGILIVPGRGAVAFKEKSYKIKKWKYEKYPIEFSYEFHLDSLPQDIFFEFSLLKENDTLWRKDTFYTITDSLLHIDTLYLPISLDYPKGESKLKLIAQYVPSTSTTINFLPRIYFDSLNYTKSVWYGDTISISYKIKDYSFSYPDTLITKYLFTTYQGDSFYSYENTYVIPDSSFFDVYERIPITKEIAFPKKKFKILSFIKDEDADTQELRCYFVYPEIDTFYMVSLSPENTLKPGDSVALIPVFKDTTAEKIYNDSLFVWVRLYQYATPWITQAEFVIAKGWVDSLGHKDTLILQVEGYTLEIPPVYMGCRGRWIGVFESYFKKELWRKIYTHFLPSGRAHIQLGTVSRPASSIMVPGKFRDYKYMVRYWGDFRFSSWGYFESPFGDQKQWSFIVEPGERICVEDSFFVPSSADTGTYSSISKLPLAGKVVSSWRIILPYIKGLFFSILETDAPNDSIYVTLLNYGSFPEDINYSFTHGNTYYGSWTEHFEPLEVKTLSFNAMHFPKNSVIPFKIRYYQQNTGREDSIWGEVFYKNGPEDSVKVKMDKDVYVLGEDMKAHVEYFNKSPVYSTEERKLVLRVGSYVSQIDTIGFLADTPGWNVELKGVKVENQKFVLNDTTEFFEEESYYFWYPRGKRDGKRKGSFVLQMSFRNSRTHILGKDSLIYAFVLKDTLRMGLGKKYSELWGSHAQFIDTLSIPDVSSIYALTFIDDYIYITADQNRIFKIKYQPTNFDPYQIGKLGTIESINQDFSEPMGITARNGNLYLVEAGNSRILKLDGNFNVLDVIRDTGFVYPVDIEIDMENYIWVTDPGKNKIIKVDNSGNTLFEIGNAGYELIYIDSMNTVWALKSDGGYERWTKTGNKIEIREEYPLGEAIGFNIEEPETPILYSIALTDTTYLEIFVQKFLPAGGVFGKVIYREGMPGGDVKFIDYDFDYANNQGEVRGWFIWQTYGWVLSGYADSVKWYPVDSLLSYVFPFPQGIGAQLTFHFNMKREGNLNLSPEIYSFQGIYTFMMLNDVYRSEIFKDNFEPNSPWDTLLIIEPSPFISPGKYTAQLSLLGKDDFPLGINSFYFFDIVYDSAGLKISPGFSSNPFKGDSSDIRLKLWNFTPVKKEEELVFISDNDTLFKDSVVVDTQEVKNFDFKMFMDRDTISLFAHFKEDTFYTKDSLLVFPADIDVIPEITSPSEFYYDSIPVKLVIKPFSAEGKLFSKIYFQKDTIRDTFIIKLGDTISVNYYLKPKFARDDTIYLELSTYTQSKLYALKGLAFKGGGRIETDTSFFVQDTSFVFGYRITNPSDIDAVYKTYFYVIDVNSDTIKFYSKEDTVSENSEKESSLNMSVPYPGVYRILSFLKEKSSEMKLDTSQTTLYSNLVNYVTVDTLILKGADERGFMRFLFPVHLPYANMQFLKCILTHPAGKDTIEDYILQDDTLDFSVFPSWEKGEYDIKLEIFNLNENLLYSGTFRKRLVPLFYLETKDTFYVNIEDSLLEVPVLIKNKGTAKGYGFCEARWFEDFGFAEFTLTTDSSYRDTFYLLNPDYLAQGTYTITFNLNDRTEFRWVKFKGYHLSVTPFTDKRFYLKGDTAEFFLKIRNLNDLNPKVLTGISLPFYEDDTLMFITGFLKNVRVESIGIRLENKDSSGIYVSPLFSGNAGDTLAGILYPQGNKVLKFRKCNLYGKAETGWMDTIYPPIEYYQFKIFIPENDTLKCDSVRINDTLIKEFPEPEKILSFRFSLDSLPVRIFYGLYLWPSMRGILLRDYPVYEGDSFIAVYPENPEYIFGDTIKFNVFSEQGGNLKVYFWDNDTISLSVSPGDTFFYKVLPPKGLSGSYEITYIFEKDTILRERSFEIEIKGIEINVKNFTIKPDTIYPEDTLRISMQMHVPYLIPETTYIYFDLLKDDTLYLGMDTLFLNKGINLCEFSFDLPSISKGQAFLRYKLVADSILSFYSGKWINIGSIDTIPPSVSFVYPDRIYEDDSLIIKAKVFDESEVSDTLFYRIKGSYEWNKIIGEREDDTTFVYRLGTFSGNNEVEFYGIYVDNKGNLKREPLYGEKCVFVLKGLSTDVLTHEISDSSLKIWWGNPCEEFVKDKGTPFYEISQDTLKFRMPVFREKGVLSKLKIYLKNPEADSMQFNLEIESEIYTFSIPPDTSGWFEFGFDKEVNDTMDIILFPSGIVFYADGEIPVYSYYKRYGVWEPLIYGNLLLRPALKYIADSLTAVVEYKVYRSDTTGSFLLAGLKDTFFVDTTLQNERVYTYFVGTVLRNPLREFIGNPHTVIFDYTPPRFSDTMLIRFPDEYVFRTRIYDRTGIKEDSLYVPDFSYSVSHDSIKADTFFFTIPKSGVNIRFYLMAWDMAENAGRFPDTGFIYITEGLSGVIPHDTVFSGDVEVTGDITVPESVKVTLLPGTRFIFDERDALKSGVDTNHIEIMVYGEFYAQGSMAENVIFEVQDTGRWFGIRYLGESRGRIEYSLVKDAIKGINAGGDTVYLILNEIRDNETGVSLEKGHSFVLANEIHSNNIGIESEMEQGLSVLSYNFIYENDSTGILIKENPLLVIGNLYNSDTLDDGANRIYENGGYDIINLCSGKIYAQGNFWKSMDSSQIDLRIYDNEENPSSGEVDFKGFYIWGNLGKKTRWEGIISIGGDVIVPEKGKLEIVKGTKIRFIKQFDITKSGEDTSLCELIVYGKLKVKGMNSDCGIQNSGFGTRESGLKNEIIFISDGFVKEKGDWYGIVFRESEKSKVKDTGIGIREVGIRDSGFGSRGLGVRDQGLGNSDCGMRIAKLTPSHIFIHEKNEMNEKNEIKNIKIEYAYKGIEVQGSGFGNREVGTRGSGCKEKLKIKDSEIESCVYGIYFEGERLQVKGSKVSLCDTGIIVSDEAQGEIKETEIRQNQIGIKLKGESEIKIEKSYIMENEVGIYVDENSEPEIKNGKNYICYNTFYNLYNKTPYDINAEKNWWGTTNSDSISLFIYDFYDDSTKGIVYFEPIWVPGGSYANGGIQGYGSGIGIQESAFRIKNTIFRKFAEIELFLPEKSKFSLKIYDVTGRKIRELSKNLAPGIHRFKINNLKKGVYFIEVKFKEFEKRFKIVKL